MIIILLSFILCGFIIPCNGAAANLQSQIQEVFSGGSLSHNEHEAMFIEAASLKKKDERSADEDGRLRFIKNKLKRIKKLTDQRDASVSAFTEKLAEEVFLGPKRTEHAMSVAFSQAAGTEEAQGPRLLVQHKLNLDSSMQKLKWAVPAIAASAASLMILYFVLKKLSVQRPKIIEQRDTSMLTWWEKFRGVAVPPSDLASVVLSPIKKRQVLDKFSGITNAIRANLPLSNMLFYGKPGTGKTMAAQAFARSLYEQGLAHHVIIRGPAFKRLGSAGAAQQALADLLRFTMASELPSILIFDEAESMFLSREDDGATEMTQDLVTTLLSFFEKAASKNCMIIFSTNFWRRLDAAILNRVDPSNRVEFEAPGATEISALIDVYLKQHIIDNGFSIDRSIELSKPEIVESLTGFVGREIDSLCVQALYSLLNNNKKSLDANTFMETIGYAQEGRLALVGSAT